MEGHDENYGAEKNEIERFLGKVRKKSKLFLQKRNNPRTGNWNGINQVNNGAFVTGGWSYPVISEVFFGSVYNTRCDSMSKSDEKLN